MKTFGIVDVLMLALIVATTVGPGDATNPGDSCCYEDWVKLAKPMQDALIKYSGDLENGEFQTVFKNWTSSIYKYYVNEEPEGLCGGQFNLKCVKSEVKDKPSLCACNNEGVLNYIQEKKQGEEGVNVCLGAQGSFCYYEKIPFTGCLGGCEKKHDVLGFCSAPGELTGGEGGGEGAGGGDDGAKNVQASFTSLLGGLVIIIAFLAFTKN